MRLQEGIGNRSAGAQEAIAIEFIDAVGRFGHAGHPGPDDIGMEARQRHSAVAGGDDSARAVAKLRRAKSSVSVPPSTVAASTREPVSKVA